MANTDLWKQAYRNQYGSDPDQDMAQNAQDVEQWRVNWQSGYDAGEQWAKDLLNASGGSNAGGQTGMQSGNTSIRTFADMERQNPNIRQQYDTWRNDVAGRGQDATDWDTFRSWLTSQGSPDPGPRPPDDFVGDDYKARLLNGWPNTATEPLNWKWDVKSGVDFYPALYASARQRIGIPRMRHDPDAAVFRDRARGPTIAAMRCEPPMARSWNTWSLSRSAINTFTSRRATALVGVIFAQAIDQLVRDDPAAAREGAQPVDRVRVLLRRLY